MCQVNELKNDYFKATTKIAQLNVETHYIIAAECNSLMSTRRYGDTLSPTTYIYGHNIKPRILVSNLIRQLINANCSPNAQPIRPKQMLANERTGRNIYENVTLENALPDYGLITYLSVLPNELMKVFPRIFSEINENNPPLAKMVTGEKKSVIYHKVTAQIIVKANEIFAQEV